MRSAVFYGKHDLRIEDHEMPKVGPKDVLIQVKACGTHWDFLLFWERSECNVINDTYSEVVLWLWQLEVLEYSNNLSWSCIRRTETVATANDQWLALVIVES